MAAQPAAAQSLVKMLGGSERDRCGAYAELETTEDSALATACTPALLAVLAKPAAEVGYLEWCAKPLWSDYVVFLCPALDTGKQYSRAKPLDET
eukprot:SAG31_NODE_441_length_15661_cov_17.905423_2_plen_94_part_00